MSGSNSSAHASDATPEAALAFTVHSMPSPSELGGRRTRSGRLKMLLVLFICAAPVAASYFTYFVIRPEGRTNYSELIDPQRPIPDGLPMTDLQGHAVSATSLKGQWLLAVVSGGQCDAVCERSLWLQRQLRETLGADRDRVDKIWFIDDAATPRPETLRAISTDSSMKVLRVPQAALAAWLQPAAGQTLESHMVIIDPMGNWMMRVPADPDASKLKRDLTKLLRASAGWDTAGR